MEDKEINTNLNEKNNEEENQNENGNDEKKGGKMEEFIDMEILEEGKKYDENDLIDDEEIEKLMIIDNKKKFKFCSSSFFLTYPQTDFVPREFFKLLQMKMGLNEKEIIKCVVSREDHKDTQGKHMHVWGQFAAKLNTRKVDFFDIDGHHPHIVSPKNKIGCIKYVIGCTFKKREDKKDIYAFKIDVNSYLTSVRLHRAVDDLGELMKKKMTVTQYVDRYPQALLKVDKLQRNLDIYHNQKNFQKVAEESGSKHVIDRRSYWIYGTPRIGKSWAIREMYEENDIYLKDTSKWWDRYVDQNVVLLDDFNNGNMVREINIWSDRYVFNGEVKGGYVTLAYKYFFVTSNFTIPQLFLPKYKDAQTGKMEIDWDNDLGNLIVESIQKRFVFIKADNFLGENGFFDFEKALKDPEVQKQIARIDGLNALEKASLERRRKRVDQVKQAELEAARQRAKLEADKKLLIANEPFDEIAIFPDDNIETIKLKKELTKRLKDYFYYHHQMRIQEWNEKRADNIGDMFSGDDKKIYEMYEAFMMEEDNKRKEELVVMKRMMRKVIEKRQKKREVGVIIKDEDLPTEQEFEFFVNTLNVIEEELKKNDKIAKIKTRKPYEDIVPDLPPKVEPPKVEPPVIVPPQVRDPIDVILGKKTVRADENLGKPKGFKNLSVFPSDMTADDICKVLKKEAEQEAKQDVEKKKKPKRTSKKAKKVSKDAVPDDMTPEEIAKLFENIPDEPKKEVKDEDVVPEDLTPAQIEALFKEKEKEREKEKEDEDSFDDFLKKNNLGITSNLWNPEYLEQQKKLSQQRLKEWEEEQKKVQQPQPPQIQFQPFPFPSPKTSPQPSLRDLYLNIDEPGTVPFIPPKEEEKEEKVIPPPYNPSEDEFDTKSDKEAREIKRTLAESDKLIREYKKEHPDWWEVEMIKKADKEQGEKFHKMKKFLDIETTKEKPKKLSKAEKNAEVNAPGYKEINLDNYNDDDFDVDKKYSQESSMSSFIVDDDADVYVGRKRKLKRGMTKKQKKELSAFMEKKVEKKVEKKEEKKDPSKYYAKYPDARIK